MDTRDWLTEKRWILTRTYWVNKYAWKCMAYATIGAWAIYTLIILGWLIWR